MGKNIRVGITHGDINGISYEIIMKALSDTRVLDGKLVLVYGSSKVANYYKKDSNMSNFNFNTIKDYKK